MTTFLHPMSSCMGRSPDHRYQTATSPFNQDTQPTTLIKKPISRSKQSKQTFIVREPASTNVSLTIPNQCTYGTQGSASGNRARFCQNPDREPRTSIVEINDKLYQRTREHLRPKSTSKEPSVPRTEDKSVPSSPRTTSKTAFGQESVIKQPATTLTRVDGNPSL